MTKLVLAVFMTFLVCVAAQAREPVAESAHFAFHSDFTMNVHDALLAAGVARNAERDELFHSGDEQACFDALAPSAQAGWDLAADYYARVIAPHSFNDRQQALPRLQLARIDNALDEQGRAFLEQTGHFIAAAAPAYRACRWEQQDAANRLSMPPKRTMRIAQQLYEGIELEKGESVGLITYMRTDSTRIAGPRKGTNGAAARRRRHDHSDQQDRDDDGEAAAGHPRHRNPYPALPPR